MTASRDRRVVVHDPNGGQTLGVILPALGVVATATVAILVGLSIRRLVPPAKPDEDWRSMTVSRGQWALIGLASLAPVSACYLYLRGDNDVPIGPTELWIVGAGFILGIVGLVLRRLIYRRWR